jgi:hypothetical protein
MNLFKLFHCPHQDFFARKSALENVSPTNLDLSLHSQPKYRPTWDLSNSYYRALWSIIASN